MTGDARGPNVSANRSSVGVVLTVLVGVLLLSSAYSVFVKLPGPRSYPFHVVTFVLSAGYVAIRLLLRARARRTAATPARVARGPVLASTLIFFGCLAVYQTNIGIVRQRGDIVAPYTAWLLMRTGSFTIPAQSDAAGAGGVTQRLNGALISSEPPGVALAAMPLMAPLALFREREPRLNTTRRIGKFLAALYSATAVTFFYMTCRVVAPGAAVGGALLLGLGTGLWSMGSQGLLGHAPAVFWLCVALFLLVRSPVAATPGLAAVIGLAAGLAVLARPVTVVFAIATVMAQAIVRDRRSAAWTAVGVTVPVLALVWYNVHHFGGWRGASVPWAVDAHGTPVWLGLAALLLAPSAGLLVYSPALVLAAAGAWMLLRRRIGTTAPWSFTLIAWGIGAVVFVLVTAAGTSWWRAESFGPRPLIEALPALALLAALGLDRARGAGARQVGAALITLSIVVQAIGVLGDHRDWSRRHPRENGPASLFSLRDTQIEAHSRHFFERLGVLKLRPRERAPAPGPTTS